MQGLWVAVVFLLLVAVILFAGAVAILDKKAMLRSEREYKRRWLAAKFESRRRNTLLRQQLGK